MLKKRLFKSCVIIVCCGIAVLFASCTGKDAGKGAATSTAPATGGSRIAYVDMDSLQGHYEFYKNRRAEFKKQEEVMDAELEQSYMQMQQKADAVQKKVQNQTITESEYKSAEREIMLMQQSFETRKQSLTEKLVKQHDEFNAMVKKKIDSFLVDYNKTKNYDYVISYSAKVGSSILYANKSLNITQDVIDGMNAASKKEMANKK